MWPATHSAAAALDNHPMSVHIDNNDKPEHILG